MRIIVVTCAVALAFVIFWSMQNWGNVEPDDERVFLHDGREFQKLQIDFLMTKFVEAGITGSTSSNGKISVLSRFRKKCNEILRNSDFSSLGNQNDSITDSLSKSFMSPAEKERMAKKKKIQTLNSLLARLSGIREAIILYDQVRAKSFSREYVHSAVVTLWAKEGHVIEQLQAATARQIVKTAFAGMSEEDVLVVDGDGVRGWRL